MVQIIQPDDQRSMFGRGFAKGLADTVPKEIERYRLSSGLKNLSEQKDLTPFQRFSGLASIPGATPQIIQSGSELLKQEARGKALSDFGEQQNKPKPNPFNKQPVPQEANGGQGPKHPSITKGDLLEDVQQGYIPPTIEERDAIAGEAYNANPAFFSNDPQKAIEWADAKINQQEKINEAKKTQHKNLTSIQDNVVSRLKDQSSRLNTQVPAELYSKIEDEAILATKPKKDGGRGLSEQAAIKEYGERLNDASRDFAKIGEIGNWGITLRPAADTLRSMKQLQQKMEGLDQTDNFAKKLISDSQVSPKFAYAVAEPVSRVPSINSFISKLPSVEPQETIAETVFDKEAALRIAPELAKLLKNNEKASPLAIAYELEKKGYDGSTWLQYVTDHSKELNLRQRQLEQAATPINVATPWNDWWLSSFSGIQ